MMEKLGAPQTHLGLKGMIQEVDEDKDGKISFREFLLIFRYVELSKVNICHTKNSVLFTEKQKLENYRTNPV